MAGCVSTSPLDAAESLRMASVVGWSLLVLHGGKETSQQLERRRTGEQPDEGEGANKAQREWNRETGTGSSVMQVVRDQGGSTGAKVWVSRGKR